MSGLVESLTAASNSLTAQRMGLDVVGQNMANLNTPGYTRRSLLLAELPATDPLSAGRGVEVVGVRAMRDLLVEGRLQRQHTDTAFSAALAETLATAEAAIGLPGAGLDAELTAFFDAFAALASDPTSGAARDAVVGQGQSLARAFASLSTEFTALQQDTDASIRAGVNDLNALTQQIARLNVDLATASYDVESIRDRQQLLLKELGSLSDIAVLQREDGGVDVTLTSGRALVIGANSYAIVPTADQLAGLTLGEATVTSEIRGGRLGGLLNARDTVLPRYLTDLNQLATDLATAVNTAHSSGFDANGTAGGTFFVLPAPPAGAAFGLTVAAALAADSQLVAASATGAAGDNAVARQLASLRDALVADGGTRSLFGAWGQLIFSVGSDAASARAAETSNAQIVQQLEQLRAQSSGVSYDEEAAHLMRYQRAYEANARYFQSIVDTLDTLMEMVR